MAMGIVYYAKNLWTFWAPKYDDLRVSDGLVRKLSVPEHTKQFVFAVREPESGAVIYILCVQNLSERSALDTDYLIKEIKPDAVVVQVGDSSVNEIESEEIEFRNNIDYQFPTSPFQVLKNCFIHKTNKEKYESIAGSLVLREIFGVSFYGHLLSAKRAAKEVGSTFLLLDSPFVKSGGNGSDSHEADSGSKFQSLALQPINLASQKASSVVSSSSRQFHLTKDLLTQVRLLSSYLNDSSSVLKDNSGDSLPRENYEAPSFAQSFYPLLVDLRSIFLDIPSIGKALAHAQKMLYDVNVGESVDTHLLSEIYIFRIAVEGLRIALNSAGRRPINKMGNSNAAKGEFSELSVEDKSHAILAQSLRSQTSKFKSIVAVVDASGLAGLRKHWNTPVPLEVKDVVEQLVTNCESDGEISNHNGKVGLLVNKPVVAVGAGATAVVGASSLSKVIPASTFLKIVTFKIPASLKLILTQTQKVVGYAFSKSVGPSKFATGFASSGAKSGSAMKVTVSAEKIRAVVHSVIASAEKTSLSATRTAFYEIMRKRRIRSIGFMPWATFGCSIATCTGLLVYGDGIECAAESLPAAPSIASLGRGIQSLHLASQAASQAEKFKIQKSIENLMYRFKKGKVQ